MLDADEVTTPELREEIERVLPTAPDDLVDFRMYRKTMFMGRWLKRADGFPAWIMRLVRVGPPHFEDSGHGEVPVPLDANRLGTLHEPFLHFAFSRGLDDWVTRQIRYAGREAARELETDDSRPESLVSRDRAERRRALRDLGRRLPGRPVLRFAYHYFVKLGLLEGRAALAFSSLMAAYKGLIVLKKWERKRNNNGESI